MDFVETLGTFQLGERAKLTITKHQGHDAFNNAQTWTSIKVSFDAGNSESGALYLQGMTAKQYETLGLGFINLAAKVAAFEKVRATS